MAAASRRQQTGLSEIVCQANRRCGRWQSPRYRWGPSATAPEFYRGPIRGDRVFSVAGAMSTMSGVDGRIPPGKYRVELLPDSVEGSWIRCRSVPCGPDYPNAAIVATTLTGPGCSNVLDVDAGDIAVWLSDVSLTPMN